MQHEPPSSPRHNRRGQSLVEFTIVIPIFFLFIFAIIDLGRALFTQSTLQHAMRQAGRLAVTGNKVPDPSNTNNMLSRVDSIIETARKAAVGIDITSIQISSAGGGTNGPARAGGPGDTVTVAMTSNLRLVTPMIGRFFGTNNTYTFTVRTTFRNEPFPSSYTQ